VREYKLRAGLTKVGLTARVWARGLLIARSWRSAEHGPRFPFGEVSHRDTARKVPPFRAGGLFCAVFDGRRHFPAKRALIGHATGAYSDLEGLDGPDDKGPSQWRVSVLEWDACPSRSEGDCPGQKAQSRENAPDGPTVHPETEGC